MQPFSCKSTKPIITKWSVVGCPIFHMDFFFFFFFIKIVIAIGNTTCTCTNMSGIDKHVIFLFSLVYRVCIKCSWTCENILRMNVAIRIKPTSWKYWNYLAREKCWNFANRLFLFRHRAHITFFCCNFFIIPLQFQKSIFVRNTLHFFLIIFYHLILYRLIRLNSLSLPQRSIYIEIYF